MEKLLQNTIYNFRDSVIATALEEISSNKEGIFPPSLYILHNNLKEDAEADLSIAINTGDRADYKSVITLNKEAKILATMKVDCNPTTNIMFTLHFYEDDMPKKEIYIYTRLHKFDRSFGAYIQVKDFPFKNNTDYYANFRKKEGQNSSSDKDV